eukprot:scaffold15934_cov52-Cyclotella_meneghiniana.AAC.8
MNCYRSLVILPTRPIDDYGDYRSPADACHKEGPFSSSPPFQHFSFFFDTNSSAILSNGSLLTESLSFLIGIFANAIPAFI